MTEKSGRVIAREGETTLVSFESGCGSCSGCHQNQSMNIRLPGAYVKGVSLELGLNAQLFALFNSLLLPVLFAVAAAFIADWLRLGDGLGIFTAVCGFTIGMVLCRPLGRAALAVKEMN